MKTNKKILAGMIGLIAASVLNAQANTEAFTIEEVIVTATKRAVSANDVGIAINAFTSEDLHKLGFTKPSDLEGQAANVTIKSTTGNGMPVFTIRGVGATEWSTNNLPAVGVYVDEVMYPDAMTLGFSLLDIDRVEILKGPQGYLFGRNSTGGAVSFVTRRPTPEREGYLSVDAGNYGKSDLKGAVGGGLSETLAARVAFSLERQAEGWWDNKTLGEDHGAIDRKSVRAAFDWNPTEELNIYTNLFYGKDDSDSAYIWSIPRLGCSIDNLAQAAKRGCVDMLGYSSGDDPFEVTSDVAPKLNFETWGGNVNVNYEVGDFTLTSVTGYHQAEQFQSLDTDGRPVKISDEVSNRDLSVFSQEIRLASAAGEDLRWMVGLYYAQDQQDGSLDWDFSDHPNYLADVQSIWAQESQTYSAFSHVEYDLSDVVTLTLGARIAKDKRKFDGATRVFDTYGTLADSNFYWYWGPQNINYPAPGTLDPSINQFMPDGGFLMTANDKEISYSEWAGKVGLDWRPTEDTLIYASVSRGFNSGGFLGALAFYAEDYTPFDQEILTAYEMGTKLTLLEDTMQLNAAVFYYDYEDVQKQVLHPVTFIGNIQNAGDARMSGVDLDLTWLPTDGLYLRGSVGYTHSEMITMNVASDTDFTGNRFGNQPFWTVTGLARYEWSLTEALDMALQVDGRWQDLQYMSLSNRPEETWPEYGVWNASVSLLAADGKWDMTAYMKNVSEEVYGTFGVRQSVGNTFVVPGAPKTFGVRATYNF